MSGAGDMVQMRRHGAVVVNSYKAKYKSGRRVEVLGNKCKYANCNISNWSEKSTFWITQKKECSRLVAFRLFHSHVPTFSHVNTKVVWISLVLLRKHKVMDLILTSDHSLPPVHSFPTEYEPPVHFLPSSSCLLSLSALCMFWPVCAPAGLLAKPANRPGRYSGFFGE